MTAPAPIPIAGRATAADREAWMERGRQMTNTVDGRHFALADWIAEGQAAFGDSTVRTAAEQLRISRTNFHRYRAVSSSKGLSRYRDRLAFSIVAEVAHLPEADADRILGAAESGGWTVKQVRGAAREAGVEGKLRRQRDEINRLRAENARLRLDHATALAEANRTEAGVKAGCQALEAAVRDIADILDALALGAGLSLHGNARPGVVRRVRDLLGRALERVNRVTDERIASALDRIARGSPE
ncbi:MAG: hypothetical protein F4Y03_09415 [Alphaproteobacteria bacterium]|nr:hypothetical protein [Alphaproteobacteria bacterium]